MAKVTSKLQVTIPKALAEKYGIEPGDEIQWSASGDGIRLSPGRTLPKLNTEKRLQLFDRATERQQKRQADRDEMTREASDRGWTRDELYERGRSH
ncbi:MAG TPA: AbrB/MazE/SpoVT family DNA-binding domain-containing protein [Vicinamibacteria bacterium]|nr:AbrB/MazE/SpoVT family DNA-binding domain-containing protein [Vicinamibacteria bacterium]